MKEEKLQIVVVFVMFEVTSTSIFSNFWLISIFLRFLDTVSSPAAPRVQPELVSPFAQRAPPGSGDDSQLATETASLLREFIMADAKGVSPLKEVSGPKKVSVPKKVSGAKKVSGPREQSGNSPVTGAQKEANKLAKQEALSALAGVMHTPLPVPTVHAGASDELIGILQIYNSPICIMVHYKFVL